MWGDAPRRRADGTAQSPVTLDTDLIAGLFRPLILWLHVLGALVWVGGISFQALILFPILRHREVTVEQLRFGLRLEVRFRRFMWPAVGVVLFTGLANLLNVWQATVMQGIRLPASFMGFLSCKLVCVLGIVLIQAGQQWLIHPRRLAVLARGTTGSQVLAPADQRLQRLMERLALACLGLAAVVLGCAVLLRAS